MDDRERSIFAETLAALVREGRGLGGRDVEGGSLRRFLAEPSLFALKRGQRGFRSRSSGRERNPRYRAQFGDGGGPDIRTGSGRTPDPGRWRRRCNVAAAIHAAASVRRAASGCCRNCLRKLAGLVPGAIRSPGAARPGLRLRRGDSNSSNASSACRRVRSILPRSQSISATTIGAWVGTSSATPFCRAQSRRLRM